jgi:hypothetical protein
MLTCVGGSYLAVVLVVSLVDSNLAVVDFQMSYWLLWLGGSDLAVVVFQMMYCCCCWMVLT